IGLHTMSLHDALPILLQYSFGAGRNSKLISRLVLSSDDPEIIEVALQLGLEVPFLRPSELATDETPSLAVILHALDHYEAQGVLDRKSTRLNSSHVKT